MEIANVLISDSWGEVNLESLNKGIGGREGALIYLSKEWAKNNNVTNFVNIEKGKRHIFENGRLDFVPLNITKPTLANFPYDVVIAWECPTVFEDKQIRDNIGLKICEMQVAHLGDKEAAAAEKYVDYMAVLSDWHGNLLENAGIKGKYITFPNGVDIDKYPKDLYEAKLEKKIGKNPKFVYSSSPDRGLWYLLQMWPFLRKEFPEAELSVCYGVEQWVEKIKWSHARLGEMALEIIHLMKQDGVTDLGKIGQKRLSHLQLEADAWIYPLDSIQSTETGCISAIENAAAANPIFTTDCDCMEEEFGDIGTIIDLPFNPEEFTNKVIEILTDQEYVEHFRHIGRKFAEKRNWGEISKQWLQLFNDQNSVKQN